MKKITFAQQCRQKTLLSIYALVFLLSIAFTGNIYSQCVPIPNSISGTAFLDSDFNGLQSSDEGGQANVLVTVYDSNGSVAGSAVTGNDGYYIISDLTEGENYQVVFAHNTGLPTGFIGSNNRSAIQYHDAPICDVSFGLSTGISACGITPKFVTACFVQGPTTRYPNKETIVGIDYGFNDNSSVTAYATQGETGSVWGVAWKDVSNEIFSSSFVKMNSGLKDGPYAIFKTLVDGNTKTTSKHADVNQLLGGTLEGLRTTDVSDCDYGTQVGRVGLGNLIITPDQSRLYTTVLDNNTIVSISTNNPTVANTNVYEVPTPIGLERTKEFRIFALAWRGNRIYVGGTVTASESKLEKDARFVVWTLDPVTGNFDEVFQTDYVKGYWQDAVPDAYTHSQWLTDIDFSDEDYMMLSITDRLGHRYCKPAANSRVDQQFPDLLGAWFDETTQEWKLEQNGTIGQYVGAGVDNQEGPGGGEFFANEFWPSDPEYHNETALGSILAIPGTGQVVATVYDPLVDSYSAGLHRYRTSDGALMGAKQLYTSEIVALFGKATGFGDMAALCDPGSIEIGNYAWFDANADGIQNAGETGIANLPLNLYNDECVKIASTFTDANGSYSFNNNNVAAGVFPNMTYFVEIDASVYNETTGLYTFGGTEYTICTANSGDDTSMDCDLVQADNPCMVGAFIEVNVGSTNHNFDIGLAAPRGPDLALVKTIVGDQFIKQGELTTFRITVVNQGGTSASKVGVVDYIPNGFTFDPEVNLNWTLENGRLKTTWDDVLIPSGEFTRLLRLNVKAGLGLDHTNYAEIFESLALDGQPLADGDSTADEIEDNDAGGEPTSDNDNFLLGNGTDDEDDHDPAKPKIFDLAIKVLLHEEKEYFPGDAVKFDITVYNQGNTDAKEYEISQYADAGLTFDAINSPGWTLVNGVPTLSVNDKLPHGATQEHCIYFTVGEDISSTEYESFSEISKSIPVGSGDSFDFDSTPDSSSDNDNGAKAYTNTDNFTQGTGDVDEDDHDIVVVRSKFADLALVKTVENERVRPGDEVTFKITITNQGTQPVDYIEVMDYLPVGLVNIDTKWTNVSDRKAVTSITLDEPILRNETVDVYINTKVELTAGAGALVNYAEIYKMSYQGEDLSAKDVDSTPDDTRDNDAGGNVNGDSDDAIDLSSLLDEDDQDPARVIVIRSNLVDSECLANATNPSNGQFADVFEIIGPSGDDWYISFGENYYADDSPDPPSDPNPIVLGEGNATFTETLLPNDISRYEITLVRLQGENAKVSFRNSQDEIETFEVDAGFYTPTIISGNTAICQGGTETYEVENPVFGINYSWSVDAGSIVGPSTGTEVTVAWDAADAPAMHTLMAIADDGCYSPGLITVANGAGSGAMFCLSQVNLSLGYDCTITVNPNMVLSGGMPVNAAYSVMLLDHNEEVIPNATLTQAHIGMTVTAKVIDGCSGNSCWSTILVEDKIKPTIVCETTSLLCNKIDQYGGPIVEDNCGNSIVPTMTQNLFIPTENCDPNSLGEYRRSYIAEDASGNVSEVCDVTINIERVQLADIIFPMDTIITCSGFEVDENNNPSPYETGRPIYNNLYIYPVLAENSLCNIVSDYKDMLLPSDGSTLGGVRKVMREWTVYEWCSNPSSRKFTQLIKIQDVEPPVITSCPDDMTISATGADCSATISIPLPEATDACDPTGVEIVTEYNGRSVLPGASRVVTLPYSTTPYEITYIVRDQAGLEVRCRSYISIVDDVAPIVVCDAHTIVSLNSNGDGYLYAGTIDDGSYDGCGIDRMEVIRMDAAGVCGNANDQLADRVFFCCEDIGRDNMVQLVVWDIAGNSNNCMVNVEVQDKNAPTISTLPDVTIQCTDDLFPLSQFGTPTFNDACNVTLTQDSVVMIEQCKTGMVTRTFTASDTEGSSTSTQRIFIVNDNLWNPDDNITFLPEDYTVEGICDMNQLHPDSLDFPYGRIQYTQDACDLVGDAFDDQVYPSLQGDDSCFKIVRTYIVTDWCQEEDPNYEEFRYTQIIKVTNSVAPVIDTMAIGTIETEDCDFGAVQLSATATDDCSMGGQLSWEVSVDYDQDGLATQTFDLTISSTGMTAILNGDLPVGTHWVQWTFTDACGNAATRIQEVVIASVAKPVYSCTDLTVGLGPMDTNGDGEIDAEMATFNIDTMLTLVPASSTFHPCDIEFELFLDTMTMRKDTTFDCADIGIQTITSYAVDIFGNTSICVFEIDVQDNNDVEICLDLKDCSNVPEGATFTADDECETIVLNDGFDPTQISDECGENLLYTHNYSVQGDAGYDGTNDNTTLEGAIFPIGSTTVTWTIANESTTTACSIVITVEDNTPPELENCGSFTFDVDSDGSNNDDCFYSVTLMSALSPIISDNCDGTPLVVHDYDAAPDSTTLVGATFGVGVFTVNWTATDASGNEQTCATIITITDSTAPIIACADNLDAGDLDDGVPDCSLAVTDNSLDATATDNCDMNVVVTHNFSVQGDAGYTGTNDNTTLNGAIFPMGMTTVVWTATSGDLTAQCSIIVTVTDNDEPVITCADDITVNLNDGDPCSFTGTDALDATATDGCGVATLTHDFTAGTTDNTTLAGAIFPVGETTVIWTATDASGMSASCELVVTVVNDGPVITCAESFTIELMEGDPCNYAGTDALDATADGGCGVVTITHDFTEGTTDNTTLAGAIFPIGTTTVKWTVVDEGGAMDSCEIVVTVLDDGPMITCADDITITLQEGDPCNYVGTDALDASAEDGCGVVTITHDFTTGTTDNTTLAGAIFPIGVTTVIWTATDEGGVTDECELVVNVVNEGPVISCPENQDVDLMFGDPCFLLVPDDALDATATGGCGNLTITHDYRVADDVIDPMYTGTNDNTTLEGAVFEPGEYTVTWTAVDGNNVTVMCSFDISVEDMARPACIEQDTAFVNIDTSGLYTFTIMDLSDPLVDNCDGNNLTYSFNPMSITCDSVGQTFIVAFTATDASGNESAGCPLVVVVNDGDTPECNPMDITINLDENGTAEITPNDVVNTMMSACGDEFTVELDRSTFSCNDVGVEDVTIFIIGEMMDTLTQCVAMVTVVDTLFGPLVDCQFQDTTINCTVLNDTFGGDVDNWINSSPGILITDNCPEMPQNMYTIDTLKVINPNPCGFGMSFRTFIVTDEFDMTDQCTQTFIVEGPDDPLTQADIDGLNIPMTIELEGCLEDIDLTPNNTNLGQITVDSLLGLGECFMVEITFIDVNSNPDQMCNTTIIRTWTIEEICSGMTFTFVQTINIEDTQGPILTGLTSFTASASLDTECVAEVDFAGLTVADCNAFTGTNDSPFADDNSIISPAGTYEPGVYDITLTLTDACGNVSMPVIQLVVLDESDFRVKCNKVFAEIDAETDTTAVVLYSRFFEIEDACDEDGLNLQFTFDKNDLTDTVLIFDCNDPLDTLIEVHTLYWFDQQGMLLDSCPALVRVSDPDDLCPDGIIGGIITSENGVGLPSFEVALKGADMMYESDNEGAYAFPAMPLGGKYEIAPGKDGDDRNGVNTLDLVRIQRHILELDELESPYKRIAADINSDERISGADLLALRKLLLGLDTEFTKNTSWRTVDAEYVFPDPNDPWAETLPETYDIESLVSASSADFIGVKVGDVDNSINITGLKSLEQRSDKTSYLNISKVADHTLAIEATESDVIYGIQLNILAEDIANISSDVFDNNNIHYVAEANGNYHVIITHPQGVSVTADQELLTVTYTQEIGAIAKAIKVKLDASFNSEMYSGSELETAEVSFLYDSEGIATLEVMQNRPNPWSDFTSITFGVPAADEVSFRLYDMNGRLLLSRSKVYSEGRHTIELDQDMISQAGVYYYTLQYRSDSQQYKMIKLD